MKKILIIVAVVLCILVPLTAYAATSNDDTAKSIRGFFGINPQQFTDEQKTIMDEYFEKSIDLKKETILKLLDSGALTQEQADALIERIDKMAELHKNGDFKGFPKDFGFGRDMKGRKMDHFNRMPYGDPDISAQ